jgi:hypothetical protein
LPEDDNTIFLVPRLSLYLLVSRVSQSYERKLECLIRKKLKDLRKEILLLSKSIIDNFEYFKVKLLMWVMRFPPLTPTPFTDNAIATTEKANHVLGQTTNAILGGLSAVGAAIGDVCEAPNG